MKRNENVLRHVRKDGVGIEIGASFNPIAPKSEGYNVQVIDHMNRDQLRAKYIGHGVDIDNIEEVDFVWRGGSYAELTGKEKHYDWVIASHVIEHTPDLIGFLNNCDAVLKDDGIVSLVVPDKRYCFDHYRPITGLSQVVDSHFRKATNHSAGTAAEYFLNVVSKNGSIAWKSSTSGKCELLHSLDNAKKRMESVQNDDAYFDTHAWCFVPHSFRLLIRDLFDLGLIHFQEVEYFPTRGCEFYVTLGRKGQSVDKSRIEILEIIASEIRDNKFRPWHATGRAAKEVVNVLRPRFRRSA